ncbi:MAG: TIR domain-containing protein [Geobacter sp.]|nr:TIR domain-containing protein [Geobacter sp.]
MPPRNDSVFFVSYTGEDLKWAQWIVWELQNAKPRYRCIAQFKDFAPGMNFIEKMREAAEAECTLALFSQKYFSSKYCQQELDAALTGDANRLLAVRVAPCDPGIFLQNRIYIDLVGKSIDDARNSLLSGVEAYLTLTRKLGAEPTFRKRPDFPGAVHDDISHKQPIISTSKGPLSVLFLAPQVGGLSPRAQLQEMERSIEQARFPKSVKFKGVFEAHVNSLFQELNREAPDVFHFSGKQNGGDILMRTDHGGLTTVSDMALAGMFQSLDHGLKLVVIDTCFSLRCAATIAKVVPCAIGVKTEIYENDATTFYGIFYQAVASGRSLKDAIAQASTALKFTKVPEEQIPQLCCREDVDPSQIFLVEK